MKSMVSVLEYDLQFFAKDGPGGEKTEQPTAKKLTDARNEGNVAKSKDLVSAVSLIVSFVLLKFLVGNIGTGLMNVYGFVYKTIATLSVTYADECGCIIKGCCIRRSINCSSSVCHLLCYCICRRPSAGEMEGYYQANAAETK